MTQVYIYKTTISFGDFGQDEQEIHVYARDSNEAKSKVKKILDIQKSKSEYADEEDSYTITSSKRQLYKAIVLGNVVNTAIPKVAYEMDKREANFNEEIFKNG